MKHTMPNIGLAMVLSFPGAFVAAAEERPDLAMERPIPMTVGLWALGARPFAGSGEVGAEFKSIFSFRAPDERDWLILPSDNGGATLFQTNNFRFGPSINIVGEREEADDRKILEGLGSVEPAYEVGAFAEFWPANWLRTRAEVRRGFEGHEGIVVNLASDVVWEATEKLRFTPGPRFSFADDDYLQTYYGVNRRQAATSGLKRFDAGSGLETAGVAASMRYELTDQWAMLGYAEVGKLLDGAEKSPIVDRGSDTTLTVGGALA